MQGLTPFQSNYNIEHLHALTSHSMLMPVLQQEESKLAPSLMVRSSPATTVRSPWCTWGLGGWRRGVAETACWWPHRLCTVLCQCQARPGEALAAAPTRQRWTLSMWPWMLLGSQSLLAPPLRMDKTSFSIRQPAPACLNNTSAKGPSARPGSSCPRNSKQDKRVPITLLVRQGP